MDRFSFRDFLASEGKCRDAASDAGGYESFSALCEDIKTDLLGRWSSSDGETGAAEIQKRAIIGYEKEKAYFLELILDAAERLGALGTQYPPWYPDLAEAVFQENWGFAGLSEWFSAQYAGSSSAKLIADRIYFMKDGRMQLMPQRMERQRFDQLVRAVLLLTPSERMDRSYYELYLLDGTRVTVYTEPLAKSGQPCMVLRRYIIPRLTFSEQADRGTVPRAAIPLFEVMVKIGFNVVFLGAVRTAKTTFLATWQALEDPSLEGVIVETDPEIPMHRILPEAPVMQLTADGAQLSGITKNLLRSDADYFILAEARDGIALDTAVRLASKGSKRMKMTFHSRRPDRFPYEAASEIVKSCGGEFGRAAEAVASSFDYIFHFVQPSDRSKKRLDGIYQMGLGGDGSISIEAVCSYDKDKECWIFRNIIGEAQEAYAREFPEELAEMKRLLTALAEGPVR
ncbi:MAG: Flp pilus assembly complex ATPase component TadA [Firmicutes bacterium]|nr:Flp pilus assembly complex ATPase component TadA [Bacillota bacterium]